MKINLPQLNEQLPQAWTTALKAAMAREGVSTEQIAEALDVSVRSMYRRLNGSKEWSLSEYQRLTSHFSLQPLPLTDKPYYKLQPTHPSAFTPTDFIQDLEVAAQLVAPEDGRYALVGGELPTYHVLSNPVLARFVAIMGINSDPSKPMVNISRHDIESSGDYDYRLRTMAASFASVDSTEVWGMAPLRPILGQIRTVSEVSAITPDALDLLNEQLLAFVSEMEAAALNRKKFSGGAFDLRFDRQRLASTVFGVDPSGGAASYAVIAYDLPRVLITMDPFGHQFYREYVDAKVSLAESIAGSRSGVMSYFNELRKQVNSNAQTAVHSLSRFT